MCDKNARLLTHARQAREDVHELEAQMQQLAAADSIGPLPRRPPDAWVCLRAHAKRLTHVAACMQEHPPRHHSSERARLKPACPRLRVLTWGQQQQQRPQVCGPEAVSKWRVE